MSAHQMDLTEAPKGVALTPAAAAAVRPVDIDRDPLSVVRLALDKNVGVETVEKMVALAEHIADRNARAAYFEAVAGFQEECPPITKSKTADITTKSGARFAYQYAPLDVIAKTIRPVLRKYGLSYSWDVEQGERALRVICTVRHVEGHAERATFPVPVDEGSRMSAAQANGAALTYGKRQSLVAVLGLTTADPDTDGGRAEDVETLEPEEAANVSALLDELSSQDQAAFLDYMNVAKVSEIRRCNLKRAVDMLQRKRGSAR